MEKVDQIGKKILMYSYPLNSISFSSKFFKNNLSSSSAFISNKGGCVGGVYSHGSCDLSMTLIAN
jgi:hypothetical protein